MLNEVALIAAEDTRRSAKLLRHYRIQTPTLSFNEHNQQKKTPHIISLLKEGKSIALVTDAGTPLLSDPGSELVKAAHAHQLKVQAIPGASAILTSLIVSGLTEKQFTFAGFPPSRSNARKKWLLALSEEKRPLIFFEAPHRICNCLKDIHAVMGNRQVSISREQTKLHEELVIGPIYGLLDHFEHPKGEFTIIVSPSNDKPERVSAETLSIEFGQLTENGESRRDSIRKIAKKHHLSSREVYKSIEDFKTR